MSDNIQIVMPSGMTGCDMDGIVSAIVSAIALHFGGEGEWADKYGTDVDNPTFKMHRYCWCESESCEYCREEKRSPNFHYKKTGLKVWWYKYIGRSMEFNREPTIQELAELFHECVQSKGKATT